MEREVGIPAREASLDGSLTVPDGARGIVLFVHGSGSSRHSKRNRFVACTLNEAANEEAMARMRCRVKLEVVPGATHLFKEPGALETVAGLASDWFLLHL